jgi:uncharacterized protein DUF3179
VWKRTAGGRELHFYLAGINNQNFLMRDRETGSWWQQVSGRAISGPLQGAVLQAAPYDELTFGLWKSESPHGAVLAPVAGREKDYDDDWEKEVAQYSVPVSFPGQGLKDRDVVLGVEVRGQSRAYPFEGVLRDKVVEDKVGGTAVALVVAADDKSVRAFQSRWNGSDIELYRDSQNTELRLVDGLGNEWDFTGCAVQGPAKGQCLERIAILKDFWFNWRNYHPQTSVYRR